MLAALATAKFERLNWLRERWRKELMPLQEAGEFLLAPGLGFSLPVIASGEKEMLISMYGRLTFAESPLGKLKKAIDAEKADSVELLPGPKDKP